MFDVRDFFKSSLDAFYRFPFSFLSSVVATFIAIYFIYLEPQFIEGVNLILVKVAIVATLGILVFTVLDLFKINSSKSLYLFVLALAIFGLLLYYFSLPNEMGFMNFKRHIFLMILFFITLFWVPFIGSSLDNIEYWSYAKEIIYALLITMLFSLVLIAGVDIALLVIEKLFDLNLSVKFYSISNVLIVGIFSVSYFLSLIPKNPFKISSKELGFEKFFTKYILTPLSVVYFVILYAYSFKVLVTLDWPKGILAWLIVAFSFVAILTYLFWIPFKSNKDTIFKRLIWLAIFLQTFMLFLAIGIRISQYSWSVNRYMIVAFGVWLFTVSSYFLLFKNAKIKWLFVSLSIVLAISQVGPFSAYSVSKVAQTKRLKSALAEYKELKNSGKIVPLEIRYKISSTIDYLYREFGEDELKAIFPKIVEEYASLAKRAKLVEKEVLNKEKGYQKWEIIAKRTKEIYKDAPRTLPRFITYKLGFRYVSYWNYKEHKEYDTKHKYYNYYTKVVSGETVVKDIKDYDYMIKFSTKGDRNATKEYIKSIDTTISTNNGVLTIKKGNSAVEFNLYEFVKSLEKRYGKYYYSLKPKEMVLTKINKDLKVKLEIFVINLSLKSDSKSLYLVATIYLGS